MRRDKDGRSKTGFKTHASSESSSRKTSDRGSENEPVQRRIGTHNGGSKPTNKGVRGFESKTGQYSIRTDRQ